MPQNNVIRSSLLGNPGAQVRSESPIQPEPASLSAPSNVRNATPEFRSLIRELMTSILETDGQDLFKDVLHPRQQVMTDQIIDERYRNNLTDMDKVPDVVRSLREFNGNPAEFSSWKKSVERILKIYEPSIGTPKYFGILNVIRNKIVGSADAALESYNTPLNWIAISRCLTMHYADKRDLSTLEYQMTCLIQGKKTIQEFYGEVYSHLTLILNKIACMEINEEAMQVLTNTYRDKALDTFIRGLSGDLSRLLGMKEPADLPEALHLCIKLENQNYRAVHANNQYSLSKKPYPSPAAFQHFQKPPLPPRNPHLKAQPFYPQLAYLPQTISRMRQFNPQFPQQPQYFNPQIWPNRQIENHHFRNPPPRPTQPKPPTPMDIDQSQQTRNVNYMNRPNFNFAGKRPPPTQSNQFNRNIPNKIQRINHITQNPEENILQEPETSACNTQENQSWDDYYQEYTRQAQDEREYANEEFCDIHFLD
ncbi:Retrovirus-related Gag polyprotein from transposon HMS-Beagle [Eumeta japonica]|uniref:Retrovirus-related Gag polyprotein from transposon HMS-Beagle n=1 Tax=Eumeta variegata TaxID=151549 RepID=A0A4C1T7R7_EUMVA|nr:Retrovirus-related Gag polyprotein from transposon HMS-Beagle [Eumeta japonica]